ncbi:hypothetical protein PBRA_003886 [Plasmodiophora brassicae]|nr:hypothetical protein PBRA_003886 [Plasmodiophora brassicae]
MFCDDGPLLPGADAGPGSPSQLARVVGLGLSFLFIFMSFNAAQNFQTSGYDPRVGSLALGLLYSVFTVSNLVSAQAVRRLGLRRSLFLGSLTYVAFVTANAFYRPWFVYLSSALLGFGAALLWTAQGSFVVRCSRADDHLNRKVPGSSLGKFNGVFFALFQANQFLGNALVAIMFNYNESPATIFTVCAFVCALGALSILLLNPPPNAAVDTESVSLSAIVRSVVTNMGDRRLLLLVPYILLNGATQSFIVGDVAALAQTNSIRFFVMAAWGAFDALASLSLGRIADTAGRIPVILLGIATQSAISGYLYQGSDQGFSFEFLIGVAACFGVVDAVYNTTVYAILGSMFPDAEAACANFKLFQSGMMAVVFFVRSWTTLTSRICIIAALILASAGTLTILHKFVHSIEKHPASSEQDRSRSP